MSVWIFYQPADTQQDRITLPFDGIPNLSAVHSPQQCRAMLKLLRVGAPPETIQREAERIWHLYHGLQREDIIAIPMGEQVALARVESGYSYEVDAEGNDVHTIGVSWYPPVKLRRFGHLQDNFRSSGLTYMEVHKQDVRMAILAKLPVRANRFVRFKWIISVVLGLKITVFILYHLYTR